MRRPIAGHGILSRKWLGTSSCARCDSKFLTRDKACSYKKTMLFKLTLVSAVDSRSVRYVGFSLKPLPFLGPKTVLHKWIEWVKERKKGRNVANKNWRTVPVAFHREQLKLLDRNQRRESEQLQILSNPDGVYTLIPTCTKHTSMYDTCNRFRLSVRDSSTLSARKSKVRAKSNSNRPTWKCTYYLLPNNYCIYFLNDKYLLWLRYSRLFSELWQVPKNVLLGCTSDKRVYLS